MVQTSHLCTSPPGRRETLTSRPSINAPGDKPTGPPPAQNTLHCLAYLMGGSPGIGDGGGGWGQPVLRTGGSGSLSSHPRGLVQGGPSKLRLSTPTPVWLTQSGW